MLATKTQTYTNRHSVADVANSVTRAIRALVGGRLMSELSDYSAAYDGLIDCIERAGWDISRLENVRHAFDDTAQQLLGELVESHPDMSTAEENSFLAPFRRAIDQFTQMTHQEKLAFRAEYDRFSKMHAESIRELSSDATA